MLQRVTTPLFYVNNKPHIGHLYSVLYADAINCWLLNNGHKSQLFTGRIIVKSIKVHQAAILSNQSPIEYCNKISQTFRQMNDAFLIRPDVFVRTTDSRHISFVQDAWKRLIDSNKIYQGTYAGWYCQSDENFIPEKELVGGLSMSGHPVDWVEEKNYFLRIEPYLKYAHEQIEEKGGRYRKELLHELSNLKDICMTRPQVRAQWGVEVPNESQHIIYVWIDALLGYLDHDGNTQEIKFHHVLGKDIVKFHQVHLPLVMKSLGYAYDANYYVHNHWIVENRKMSKSLYNQICPLTLLKKYNQSSIRLQFLSQGPQNFDVQFDEGDITKVYNDYIGSFHNSIYRILNKKLFTVTEFEAEIDLQEMASFNEQIMKAEQTLDKFDFCAAYQEIRKGFFVLNKYIDQKAPWKIVEDGNKKKVLASIIYMIKRLMNVLKPYMPDEMQQLQRFVGEAVRESSEMQRIKVHNENLDELLKKKY